MKKLGLFFIFIGVVALVGGSRLFRLNNPEAIYAESKKHLYLKEKTDLQKLSSLLVDSLQVIEDEDELTWAANLLGWRNFQPGHYEIDGGHAYDDFLSKLAKGIQDPVQITIVPGQRKEEVIATLNERMRFDSAAIYKALNDSLFLANRNLSDTTVVGHFLPDTYDMYWTLPPKSVLKRIFNEFNKKVSDSLRNRMAELEMSLTEILTLASIIEGESIHDEEKSKISGLYWNRLKRDMRLQADPTVQYALKDQRRLYNKDYKIDHPYNTYLHGGLPPGPINNPSLSSIKAALYPEKHEYLFMVARPNGFHAFTETYAEHRKKSAEWQEYMKEMENAEPDTANDSD